MKSDKLVLSITAALFFSGTITIGWSLYSSWKNKQASSAPANMECASAGPLLQMTGSELGQILPLGHPYKILIGFYDCNDVNKGDLVAYQFSQTLKPVVRIVRGLPDDRVELKENGKGNWEVMVNSTPVIGSEALPFQITAAIEPPPLNVLMHSRQGIMGEDEFLLMTLIPPGTIDSLQLGPAPKRLLLGKVLPMPSPAKTAH